MAVLQADVHWGSKGVDEVAERVLFSWCAAADVEGGPCTAEEIMQQERQMKIERRLEDLQLIGATAATIFDNIPRLEQTRIASKLVAYR